MLLKNIFLLFIAAIFITSCKKEKTTASDPDDCVQSRGVVDGDIIEGRYIVAYKPSLVDGRAMSAETIFRVSQDVLERNNIQSEAVEASFTGEPGGFIATLSDDQVASLRNDNAIQAIEPDRIVALSTCFTVAAPGLLTWNINRTGYGNGIGKKAWIIDTGIDFDHPDLTVDVAKSKSFVSGVSSADDENGHGTHVAGIIGGKNNTIGVLGVASGATLVSLRVLDKDGKGTVSSIIEALGYINSNGTAGDVVNMSVGEDEGSDILDQQVKNTASRGIYIAIAAGNDAEPARNFSPGRANAANIFTVSAIDSLDNFASFSNYGNDVVDYAVPGVRILSTFMGGKYAYMSGTSMASPHMAGLLLLKGRNILSGGLAKNDPDGTSDPIAHY